MDIIYNAKENFQNFLPERLYLCLIINGFAILVINNERYYIGCNVLLIINGSQKVELLTSYEIKANSLSFSKDITKKYWNENVLVLLTNKFQLKKYNKLFQFIIHKDTTLIQKGKYISEFFTIVKNQKNILDEYYSINTTLINSIRDYIDDHLNKNLSIKKICDIFLINRTTLSKQFKKNTGVTISKYIREIRISQAKYSLLKTNKSIKDISQMVGFQDQASFTKMFKSVTGLSPLKYRTKYFNLNK